MDPTDAMDSAGDWVSLDFTGTGTWPDHWDPVTYRQTGEGRYAFRVHPRADCGNRLGGVHGAFLAGLAEHCMGIVYYGQGKGPGILTVAMGLEYPVGAALDQRLDGDLELIRETGRMMFCRMTIRQGDTVVLMASATLRKVP